MYYFKYFRNDAYFEKSIRYNELFFAANSSLNDPMDLFFNPKVWDDTSKWEELMDISNDFGLSISDYISKPTSNKFYADINDLFRNKDLLHVVNEKKLCSRVSQS